MEKDRGKDALIERPSNVEAQAKIEDLARSPLAEQKYVPGAFDVPQRIVLRFNVKLVQEERAIIDRFFALYGLDPTQDYYSHLCAPNQSSMMHIVLDLHCNTVPAVDLKAIEHIVFKVRKNDDFHFEQLNKSACQYARRWSHLYRWGSDLRYPEELDGDRFEQ